MDTPAETPVADLADRATELLAKGAYLRLDLNWSSHNFPPVVSKKLAARIADRKAARQHAVTVEQIALFVESEHLVDGLMGVAKFLRELAGDQA